MRTTALILLLSLLAVFGQAQTTEFTYQGSLSAGTPQAPATGNYDFEFRLYDALSDGTQQGATLTRNTVTVANGIFVVPLDFGSQFLGPERFLEIGVRAAGGGAFTPLTPRQKISTTPYAMRSINAGSLGSIPASQYVLTTDQRMTDAREPTAGSANYIQNATFQQASSNFNISGNGSIGGNFRAEGTGAATTTPIASFSSAGRFDIDAPFTPGGRFTLLNNGNAGIGTNTPTQKLVVSGTSTIRANVNSDSNAGLGLSLGNVMKWSLATVSPGQFQIFNQTTGSNAFWIDNANNNVGIGVTDPGFLLDVGQRMRLRSGGNNNVSAGIYFNNNSNSVAAFVGMEDDTHVGLFGNGGAGWRFGMNTTTGALKVDGTEGQAGQVITSNGAATAQWKSPTNSLYQQTNMNLDSGSTAPGSTPTLVPGLSQTINVAANAKLFIQFGVWAARGLCVGCSASSAYIDVTIDGALANRVVQTVAPESDVFITGSWLASVGSGTHTIEIKAHSIGGTVGFGCGFCSIHSNLIVQAIRE